MQAKAEDWAWHKQKDSTGRRESSGAPDMWAWYDKLESIKSSRCMAGFPCGVFAECFGGMVGEETRAERIPQKYPTVVLGSRCLGNKVPQNEGSTTNTPQFLSLTHLYLKEDHV